VVALVRRFVLAALLAGAAAFVLPVTAAARERDIPRADTVITQPGLGHTHDTVFEGSAPGAARIAQADSTAHFYSTADGYRVEVEASTSYTPDPVADQGMVDFLASRLHGPELGSLRIYVGTPSEIQRLCGGNPRVVACYAIGEDRMFVPGESVQGIPVEYPITHEYGHHIASWRLNNPWDALDWGAKHWASAMRICTHVHAGRLFPGDQGVHYRDDPGEGFADGYAHLHYPEVPWYFNALMRPGPLEFEAIQRDVLQPWTGPQARTFRGRLGPRQAARKFAFRMKLDGTVSMRLAAPRGEYSVQVQAAGHAAGRTLRAGGEFGIEWCRRRPVERVTVTIRRRSGAGPFALTVRWPG
jgi:hypothetical protein